MHTVSRSVERTFEVLELFKRERRPLTTADVRRGLQWPHSSTVVLLTHLSSLGYLRQDPHTLAYFPSRLLNGLCAWIAEAPTAGDPLTKLLDDVHAKVGETTSVSRRSGLFSLSVHVRSADHADAIVVRPGVTGGLLTLSVTGRTLLSTLPDAEIAALVAETNDWSRATRLGITHDVTALLRTARHVRERGYLYDCNMLIPDVAAVAFPLTAPGSDTPMALTVAARRPRLDAQGARLVVEVERLVRRFEAQPATAARAPGPRRSNAPAPARGAPVER